MKYLYFFLLILAWGCNLSANDTPESEFVINDWGAQYDEIKIADENEQLVYIKKGDKWGLANFDGSVIFPPKYDEVRIIIIKHKKWESVINPIMVILTLNGKEALYKFWKSDYGKETREIAPFEYTFWTLENDSDQLGMLLARDEEGGLGCFYIDGTEILHTWYEDIQLKDSLLYAYQDSYWEVYDGREDIIRSEAIPGDPNCGMIPFMRNCKWGAINLTTRDSIPNEYDVFDTYNSYCDCARVKKNNKWGFLNTRGEEYIAIKYDTIGKFEDFGGETDIAIARLGNKWGAIDTEGNIAIPFVYNAISNDIKGDCRKVKKHDKWGLITSERKMALAAKYEDIKDVFDYPYRFLDEEEEEEEDNNDEIKFPFYVKQNGKWGIVSAFDNKVLLAPAYDSIQTIENSELLQLWKNGKQGYASAETNKVLIAPIYEKAYFFINDYASVKKGGKWGAIDRKQRVVIPFQYDSLGYFAHNRFLIQKNGKKGLIDDENELITPLYDDLRRDYQGFAFAKTAGKWQIISEITGKAITDPIYDEIKGLNTRYETVNFENDASYLYTFSDESYLQIFKVKKNGKYGWVNHKGEALTPMKYDEINSCYGGLSIVKVAGTYGVINSKGKEILPPIYDEIERINRDRIEAPYEYGTINHATHIITFGEKERLQQELLAVRKKNKWQIIDKEGKAISPLKYDAVKDYTIDFNEGFGIWPLVPFFLGGKWGFVAMDGREIPPRYDKIISYNYLIEVSVNDEERLRDKEFYIDYWGVCQQGCYNAPAGHPKRKEENN